MQITDELKKEGIEYGIDCNDDVFAYPTTSVQAAIVERIAGYFDYSVDVYLPVDIKNDKAGELILRSN